MPVALRRSLIAVVATGALVSCAGDDDAAGTGASTPATGADAPTTDSSPASTAPSPTTVESTDPTGTADTSVAPTLAPATLPPSTPPAETDGGDCLIGDWIVTDTEMNEYYAGLMATVDAPITMTATGQAALTFDAAGSYRWAPDFDLVVDIVGAPGTGETSGMATGSWTAAGGTITTAADQLELLVSITVNDTTFSGSDLADGLLSVSPVNGVTYSCAGEAPVLDFPTSDPEVFVPVELSPA